MRIGPKCVRVVCVGVVRRRRALLGVRGHAPLENCKNPLLNGSEIGDE